MKRPSPYSEGGSARRDRACPLNTSFSPAPGFITNAEASTGSELPRFIKDPFDGILESGILAHGFLRLRFGECGRDKLLAAQPERVTPGLQVVQRAVTRHLPDGARLKADEARRGALLEDMGQTWLAEPDAGDEAGVHPRCAVQLRPHAVAQLLADHAGRADHLAHLNWPRILNRYGLQVAPELDDVLSGCEYSWVAAQAEHVDRRDVQERARAARAVSAVARP